MKQRSFEYIYVSISLYSFTSILTVDQCTIVNLDNLKRECYYVQKFIIFKYPIIFVFS